jgi:hypothetical protein
VNKLIAEAVGTFGLVFAGTGAIVIDAQTGALGHVGVAITFGLIIMTMISATGHISGAHFNKAVTLAFATSRHFPWREVPRYWAAQLSGGVLFVNDGSVGKPKDSDPRAAWALLTLTRDEPPAVEIRRVAYDVAAMAAAIRAADGLPDHFANDLETGGAA